MLVPEEEEIAPIKESAPKEIAAVVPPSQ
jgi:hypothetical protein